MLEIYNEALPCGLIQVCSIEGPQVQDGPQPGGPRFEP